MVPDSTGLQNKHSSCEWERSTTGLISVPSCACDHMWSQVCSSKQRVHRPNAFRIHHIYLFFFFLSVKAECLWKNVSAGTVGSSRFYAADAPLVTHVRKYFPSANTNTSIMHMQVNSCSSIMPSLLWLILITSTVACRKQSLALQFRAIRENCSDAMEGCMFFQAGSSLSSAQGV